MHNKKWFQKHLRPEDLAQFLNRGELNPEDWKIVRFEPPNVFGRYIDIAYHAEKEIVEEEKVKNLLC